MRLSNYLVEDGGRSKIITLDEWLEIAKKKHMKTLTKLVKNNDCLYRGKTSLSEDVDLGYVDPKKGRARKSRNTSNYYTVWIDNSPVWKAYPKRSRSLICTNSFDSAYGQPNQRFIILPEDDANIGVCDDIDFWDAFDNTNPFDGLNEFNEIFKGHAEFLLKKKIPSHLSWNKLQQTIDMMDEIIKGMSKDEIFDSYLVGMMNRNGISTVRELFEHTFNPKANNIKVIKSHQPLPTGKKECWTDGKSLMLNSKVVKYEQQAWQSIKEIVK